MHEVGTGLLAGHIDRASYQKQMDYVKSKVSSGLVWNQTPTAIVKYIVTKDRCGLPVITNDVLSFPTVNTVDPRYATGITVILKTSQPVNQLIAFQNGKKLPVRKMTPSSFMADIDPTKGSVALTIVSAISLLEFTQKTPLTVKVRNTVLTAALPKGNYSIRLYKLNGTRVIKLSSGYSDGSSIRIPFPAAGVIGTFLLYLKINNSIYIKKLNLF
jgi:hypothetical protein